MLTAWCCTLETVLQYPTLPLLLFLTGAYHTQEEKKLNAICSQAVTIYMQHTSHKPGSSLLSHANIESAFVDCD